jgi:hypothetical protein
VPVKPPYIFRSHSSLHTSKVSHNVPPATAQSVIPIAISWVEVQMSNSGWRLSRSDAQHMQQARITGPRLQDDSSRPALQFIDGKTEADSGKSQSTDLELLHVGASNGLMEHCTL